MNQGSKRQSPRSMAMNESGWFFGTEIDVLGGGNGSKGPKTYEDGGRTHLLIKLHSYISQTPMSSRTKETHNSFFLGFSPLFSTEKKHIQKVWAEVRMFGASVPAPPVRVVVSYNPKIMKKWVPMTSFFPSQTHPRCKVGMLASFWHYPRDTTSPTPLTPIRTSQKPWTKGASCQSIWHLAAFGNPE